MCSQLWLSDYDLKDESIFLNLKMFTRILQPLRRLQKWIQHKSAYAFFLEIKFGFSFVYPTEIPRFSIRSHVTKWRNEANAFVFMATDIFKRVLVSRASSIWHGDFHIFATFLASEWDSQSTRWRLVLAEYSSEREWSLASFRRDNPGIIKNFRLEIFKSRAFKNFRQPSITSSSCAPSNTQKYLSNKKQSPHPNSKES